MNQGGSIGYTLHVSGMVDLVDGFQGTCWLQEVDPPGRHGVGGESSDFFHHGIEDGAVEGFSDHKGYGLLAFYLDKLCSGGDWINAVTHQNLIRVGRIYFFFKKVLVVIFKHGQSHAVVPGVTDKAERYACKVVAIKAIARVFDVGFKPNRWGGEADMGIVVEKDLA